MARRNGKNRMRFSPRKIQKLPGANLNAGEIAPATPAAGPNVENASDHQKRQIPLQDIAKQEIARKAGGTPAEQAAKESVDVLTETARTSHARTYGR